MPNDLNQRALQNAMAPAGWDQKNWDDPNMHSVKYDAGRMLNGKTKPSEVGALVAGADFQKRFPGATFNGKDWLDFKGALSDGDHGTPVGGIDVLRAADQARDTSDGIWWGAPDAQGASGAPTSHAMAPTSSGQSGLMAQILASLQAQQQIDPQTLLQQQLR